MALVTVLEPITLERSTRHEEVKCTYSVVIDHKGEKLLQLDTYGSSGRKIPGKKSQSIQLNSEAIKQLKQIIADL